jgi:DNA-binding PadR family transcriptional regulator
MYRLMLKRREDTVVKVRPGSLYHTVDRLAAAGMVTVTGTDRDGGRPERTTYCITEAGSAALREWIRSVLAAPVYEFPRFPVALGEAHNLPRPEAVELLTARMEQLRTEVGDGEELLATASTHTAEAHLLDWHFRIEMARSELTWLGRLVERIENKELTWPSENRL